LKVTAGGAAEDLQNLGRRQGFGRRAGKGKQEFLKGIVFGSIRVRSKDLFGSGSQKPPP